jgi:hypothetical protein
MAAIALSAPLRASLVFEVTDVGPALNASSPPATTLGSVSSSIAAAPGPVTYTLSGLDFTSLGGTAAEEIVFTVSFSVSSGFVAYNNVPNGNVFNGAGSLVNQVEPGEDLTATLGLTSTTFVGGLGSLSAGFTSTTMGGAGAGESWDVVHAGGTQAGSTALGITRALPQASPFWTLQNVATTGVNAGVNLQGYTVTFAAVPEPSTLLLSGFGALVLLRRRR